MKDKKEQPSLANLVDLLASENSEDQESIDTQMSSVENEAELESSSNFTEVANPMESTTEITSEIIKEINVTVKGDTELE